MKISNSSRKVFSLKWKGFKDLLGGRLPRMRYILQSEKQIFENCLSSLEMPETYATISQLFSRPK